MRAGDYLTVFSYILNFAIIAYISSALIGTQCFSMFQLIITYIGLLSLLLANIVSTIEYRKFGR